MANPRWYGGIPLVIGTSLCIGCGGGSERLDVQVDDKAVPAVSWEEYRDMAQTAGDGTGYYIAEWDLVFSSEEDLREHYEANLNAEESKLAVMQRSDGFEPTYPRPDSLDISYCVTTAFANQANVISDMAEATRAWQRITNVRFRYDASQNATCNQNNNNVDFAVMPTTFPNVAGCAVNKLLTVTGVACPLTAIGPSVTGVLAMQYGLFPLPPPQDGETPVGAMMHELGHILGFRHEHPWAPAQGGCAEAPSIASLTGRRLTSYDQPSVMHYHQCGGFAGIDFAISTLDGVGARSIYKIPAAWYPAIQQIGI